MVRSVAVLSKIPNLLKELQNALPDFDFTSTQPKDTNSLKSSEIIIADFDLIAPHINNLPIVKWVQGTWAGVDALLPHISLDNPPKYIISRYTGKHFGRLMAEYVIANIINHEREFFKIKENQRKKMWVFDGKIYSHRSISDLNVAILGVGNIGRRIGKTLNCLGAKVHMLGKRPNIDLKSVEYSFIEKYYTKSNLSELLSISDYLINVLPNTRETGGLLNGETLKCCRERQSIFINIGRGSIISSESLENALCKRWIAAAILDVFETEPLPKDSPLWEMENVFITPHVSGVSRAKDIAEQFKENFELYENNLPLPTKIDFEKGY